MTLRLLFILTVFMIGACPANVHAETNFKRNSYFQNNQNARSNDLRDLRQQQRDQIRDTREDRKQIQQDLHNQSRDADRYHDARKRSLDRMESQSERRLNENNGGGIDNN